MPGVVRGLLDKVEEDPPEVDRCVEPQQQVGGPATCFVSEAGRGERGRGADDPFGAFRLAPVPGDDLRSADGASSVAQDLAPPTAAGG